VPQPEYVTQPAGETPKLTELQFLMRKASVGTRPERAEALAVLDRSPDPAKLPFLLERLVKEDDQFLRMAIIQALARTHDVRALGPLRDVARHDVSRAALESIRALYTLGDDSCVPRLIRFMRQPEEFGDLSGAAHRILKELYGIDMAPNQRLWNAYFHAHRFTDIETAERWYRPWQEPLPPTAPGTTQLAAPPATPPPAPQGDVRERRTVVSFYDFWKPDLP
jgi:hypothetical protein